MNNNFSLDKFTKLMMMTQSGQDHEALTALRKANAMLASVNQNWEQFISSKPRPTEGTSRYADRRGRHYNETEINSIFGYLLRTVSPNSSFRKFVENVHSFWKERGYLTDAQYIALKKATDRRSWR